MKIKIEYEFTPVHNPDFPYYCRTQALGELMYACGDSWEDAEARLITMVRKKQDFQGLVPKPKEIEI